jgi:RHS repeat-associated protein
MAFRRFDDETGLFYFYQSRYYDPELGRFTQPDTIVPDPDDPQALNRYTYVNNNPLNLVDPTGHFGAAISGRTAFLIRTRQINK